MDSPDEIDEERRLAYVGITRAKQKLYLTKTRTRMLFGSTTYSRESRFIGEIPENLIERTGESRMQQGGRGSYAGSSGFGGERVGIGAKPGTGSKPTGFGYRPPAAKTGVVYHVGDTVLHKLFGKGMILSAEKMGNDTLLEIAFDKAGTKKLMANFCKMEKL